MSGLFPDNEFWQCPSYTWSSMVIGVMIAIVVYLSFLVDEKLGSVMAGIGSVLVVLWMLRTAYYWLYPNAKCEAKGYPGQHYANPFYKP